MNDRTALTEEDTELWHGMLDAIAAAPTLAAAVLRDQRLGWANATARRLLDLEPDEDLDALDADPALAALRECAQRAAATGRAEPCELVTRAGRVVVLELRGLRFPGAERSVLALATDVTETRHVERKLGVQPLYDPLTGLPNRALFLDRLKQAFFAAIRARNTFGVLLAEIDGLGRLHATQDRPVLDAALAEVALRLQASTRAADTVARTGDSLFAVLLPQIDAQDEVSIAAQRVIGALDEPLHAEGRVLHLKASVGAAVFPEHGRDPESMLAAAAAALREGAADGGSAGIAWAQSEADDPSHHVSVVHWSDVHEVGIAAMDEHHRRMLVLINQLGQQLISGTRRDRLLETLARVTEFTAAHFADEERMMAEHGIPGAERHAREHRRLLDELRGVAQAMEERDLGATIRNLQEWFYRHIDTADRALGRALLARGVSEIH